MKSSTKKRKIYIDSFKLKEWGHWNKIHFKSHKYQLFLPSKDYTSLLWFFYRQSQTKWLGLGADPPHWWMCVTPVPHPVRDLIPSVIKPRSSIIEAQEGTIDPRRYQSPPGLREFHRRTRWVEVKRKEIKGNKDYIKTFYPREDRCYELTIHLQRSIKERGKAKTRPSKSLDR